MLSFNQHLNQTEVVLNQFYSQMEKLAETSLEADPGMIKTDQEKISYLIDKMLQQSQENSVTSQLKVLGKKWGKIQASLDSSSPARVKEKVGKIIHFVKDIRLAYDAAIKSDNIFKLSEEDIQDFLTFTQTNPEGLQKHSQAQPNTMKQWLKALQAVKEGQYGPSVKEKVIELASEDSLFYHAKIFCILLIYQAKLEELPECLQYHLIYNPGKLENLLFKLSQQKSITPLKAPINALKGSVRLSFKSHLTNGTSPLKLAL